MWRGRHGLVGHLHCRPDPRICMQEGLPISNVLLISSVTAARVRTRKGAELSKRVSVCQRSSQGAEAPQRSARAERGCDSLPRHLELTRTSAKGSFSFTEGSCGKCIPLLRGKRDELSGARAHLDVCISGSVCPDIPPTFAPLCRPFGRLSARAGILKTILFLCNTMQARPARFEGGRDGEDSRR